jgi:hypothetical protein
MSKYKYGKNILPLLAVTALLLSVSLANYNDSIFLGTQSNQSVLSESDENEDGMEDEKKSEEKSEKRENKERGRTEVRSVESEKRVEATRKPEPKLNREKMEVKEELKVENENRDRNRVQIKNENELSESENEIEVEDSNDQDMESEFEQETETVSADGVASRYKLKVKSKIVNGKTFVETTAGEVEVENSPEDAVNELIADGVIDTPMEFEVKTENDKVEFEFKGVEDKRFLGLFRLSLPKTVIVDADSGEVTETNRSAWNRFLNLLSI